ncbi:MAG: hypothetical protein ACREEW_18455 [Caulobacteraceae bacterium]
MEKFVARQNAKRFRGLLQQESDPKKREVLTKLIAEEEAKLGDLPSEDEVGASET